MSKKTGVFFCRCGGIITDKVNEEAVLAEAKKIGDNVVTLSHNLLCSAEGKAWLAEQIKKNRIDNVVVAACSPKQHEKTFMEVLENTGLNPHMLQMANIREQCVWMTTEPEEATKKAIAYVRAATRRVQKHEPLEKRELTVNPDILIVGAGMAGIEAAQTSSRAGRKVYLVEKEPCIGGLVARFEEVYPSMECAPCMVATTLQEIIQDNNIDLFTYSEVKDVKGYLGNFEITILKKAKSVDETACLGCGECYPVCPVSTSNKYDDGLSERKAIYVPFNGALPNIPVIDRSICLRFNGQDCNKCEEACPLDAIDFSQEDKEVTVNVGGIILSTGAELYDPSLVKGLNYGKIPDIYTSMHFERMISGNGPTGGEIVLKNGQKPRSVALIHCVGSRKPEYNDYCSGICCMYNLKFARSIKEREPQTKIYNFYTDLCLPGKESQKFADESLLNTMLVHFNGDVEATETPEGIKLSYMTKDGGNQELTVDMVVLAPAIVPPQGTKEVGDLFGIELDERGFFKEDHNLMNPFSSSVEGIQLAGMIQGPKGVEESVAQAAASSGRLLSRLVPGRVLEVESKTTTIDEDSCGGCKICIGLCPYSAISFDIEKMISTVNEILCKGCGTCAAACPSGAAKAKHFTRDQIRAEIKEVTI